MSDVISREKAVQGVRELFSMGDCYCDELSIVGMLNGLPLAEPETITIEEVSNQLGCATIQSALYWFEFLKTLDLLGFAIVRKKTR